MIGRKKRLLKKAKNAEKVRAQKEAKESLDRLKMLEAQREEILEQLQEAKEKVFEVVNPALQANMEGCRTFRPLIFPNFSTPINLGFSIFNQNM